VIDPPQNAGVVETAIEHARPEEERPVEVLLRLAARARLFRAADAGLHARVPVGDRHEIYGLKTAAFRDWLIGGYYADQGEPASDWAIRRVVGALEARARFDGGTPSFFIRVGRAGGGDGQQDRSSYFLDLGDPSGRAIEISADGWSVVDRPGVQFRRPEGHLPFPVPSRDGSIDLLRPFVNLTESDFRLLIAWMTAALRPVGPYPILVLNSQQGSSKTTLARILRLLIDPQSCPLLSEPASTRDLVATAVNGWLLAYDNLSAIPTWLSDGLCRLVYGVGFAGRTLFCNDERSIIHAQRPVILTGIDEIARRGDLRDRCIFLHPPMILPGRRRTEDEFWSSFHAVYPRILGGVLDAIVGGLRALPSVRLSELPRMADYAKWGEAVHRGMGLGAESFASTYNENRKDAARTELEDSPLGTVMLDVVKSGASVTITASDLHAKLSQAVGRKVVKSRRWPKTVSSFSSELRRMAPQLLAHGLFLEFSRNSDRRTTTLRPVESPGTPASGAGPNS
jgi:hypothetical protein